MKLQKQQILGALTMAIGVLGILFILGRFLDDDYRHMGSRDMMQGGSFGYAVSESADSYYGTDASGVLGMPAAAPNKMMRDSIMVPPEPPYGSGSVAVDVPPEERLIIRSGNLALVVSDVPLALEQIGTYATEHQGFVVSSNIDKVSLAFVGNITVRVPEKDFETTMTAFKQFGEVRSQQSYGQDVTEEFVDVEAQLANLRATETQFLEIMKRAQKIEDILAVQRELSNVRGQIDMLEGRKQYLSQSAAMSTISVNLSTDPRELPVVDRDDEWKPLAEIKDAVRSLLAVAKGFVNVLIRLVIFIPLWAAIGAVLWLLYRGLRRGFEKWIK